MALFISDLVDGVVKKLRNRDDVRPDIPNYIKKTILDLTQNYEFEELRTQGPLANFVPNQAIYSKEAGPNNPFIYPSHLKITFIVSWFCYFVSTVTPGQSTGLEIKQRAVRVVEPMSTILGQPTVCTIVGDQILVGFMPNINYAAQMRYQRQHPFNPANTLAASEIKMPDDWQEIVEYGAAAKACGDIGMWELGQVYYQMIYGNPKKQQPGVIAERLSQQDRNVTFNERQLRPIVRRFT